MLIDAGAVRAANPASAPVLTWTFPLPDPIGLVSDPLSWITEAPAEMFGKIMSISDTLMWRYFELLSFRSMAEIGALRAECEAGRNPRDAKVMLGEEIVTRFHSAAAAARAIADFEARFRQGALPDDIPEVAVSGAPMGIAQLLRQAGLVSSASDAMRNIEQGGVRIDGQRIEDKSLKLEPGSYLIQVGKRRYARVRLA
jgi:tyrosyl-tRNA synthetase